MAIEYKLTWKPEEKRWRKMYRGRWLTFPGEAGKKASYPQAWKAFKEAKLRIDLELDGESNSYLLTWRDKDQRWTKIYKGRQLYFSGTGGKEASYPVAWKAFQEAKLKIDSGTFEEADAHDSAFKDIQLDLDPNSKEFLLQWKDHLASRFWISMNKDDGFQAVIASANIVHELSKVVSRLNWICGTDTYSLIEAIGLCDEQAEYTLFELCQAAWFNRSGTPLPCRDRMQDTARPGSMDPPGSMAGSPHRIHSREGL